MTTRMKYGFSGTILEIDLSTGSVERIPVTRDMAEQFIGGQGLGAYLLNKYVAPGIDPLGPDNALIVCPGILIGTPVPSASRTTIMAKSPTIGAFMGMSNGGGLQHIKLAGYDILVVKGCADRPVYIKITNDRVEICDARHLWGKDTFETPDILWPEIGKQYQIATIGPAGENLVRHAAIIGDKYISWGRTGLGAVMGSKKLKAIAVFGDVGVKVAQQPKLMRLALTSAREITGDTESMEVWRTGGTWKWSMAYREKLDRPRAMSEVFDLDKYDEKLDHRPIACMGCPVGCKHTITVKEGQRHSGLNFVIGCTSGTMCGPFGSGLGIVPIDEVAKCAEEVQRLGMDSSVTAGLISYSIELYEAGIISGNDTGGIELAWSDPDIVRKMMAMIAHREGFGDLLAEGVLRACDAIGNGAEKYLLEYKGMARAEASRGTDVRKDLNTFALAWSLNFRGHGDRHRYPYIGATVDQKEGNIQAIQQLAGHLGIPEEEIKKQSSDAPEFVPWAMKYVEDYNTVAYCLGLCDRPVILNALSIGTMTEIYNAATGLDLSSEDLLRAGRRIWNLEKAWVTLQGQRRKDDYPPERFYREESKTLGGNYPPLNRETFEQILNRYYEAQGWDIQTGVPKADTLTSLGLDQMARDIARYVPV